MQKLKINFFGEQWTLKKVVLNSIEKEYFNNIAYRIDKPLYKALLDPFFYFHLKLNSISSLDKLPCTKVSGLLNSSTNQIEIWLDGIKIRKLKFEELYQEQYLFPLFKTKKTKLENQIKPGIYIEEKEIGFIGSYEFLIKNFVIDDLEFGITELNDRLLLIGVTYSNYNSVFKKKETLINYQNSYLIED